MKKQLKSLLFLLLFIIISCQKENFNNDAWSDNQTKIQQVSLNELLGNNNFKIAFQTAFKQGRKNLNNETSKQVAQDQFDFTFQDQDALVVNTDSIISYTFVVDRNDKVSNNTLSNLVIETDTKYNRVKATLLTYQNNTTINEIDDIAKPDTQVSFSPINYSATYSSTSKMEHVCIEITYFECNNPKATHEPGGYGCEAKPQTKTWCSWIETDPFQTGSTSSPSGTNGGSWGGGGTSILTVPVISENYYTPNRSNGGNFLNITTNEISFLNSKSIDRRLRQLILANYITEDMPEVTASQILTFLKNNQQTLTDINNYLINNDTEKSKEFVKQLINYCIKNPSTTWEQIQNWFLGNNPKKDGKEDIDPNLITFETPVTLGTLPSFNDFINGFPKNGTSGNYSQMPANEVYNLVGGTLLNSYNNDTTNSYSNACSIRGSRGLLYSNITIPVLKYNGLQRTQKGGDLKNYILDAVSFDTFMKAKFGEAQHVLTGTDANDLVKVADLLKGKNGIYVIINNNPSSSGAGYSGHVDTIINGLCVGNAYTRPRGGVKSIKIWTLN